MSTMQIEVWANDLLQFVATALTQHNNNLVAYVPEIYEWLRITLGRMEEANKKVTFIPIRPNSSFRKRLPQFFLELLGGSQRCQVIWNF